MRETVTTKRARILSEVALANLFAQARCIFISAEVGDAPKFRSVNFNGLISS
ncbi:MAG: hypothetical protein AB8B63_07265 [Granulosicoccus sp.]